MDVDITVVEPKTILDRATIDRPAQTSTGVTVVIDHAELDLTTLPGRAVRRTDG